MRSVIKDADPDGVTAIVDQQFEYAARISAAGLVPVIEPEVSIGSPHKDEAESLLRDLLQTHIAALPQDATIMLKLTIPTQPGLYAGLAADPRVLQVLALSGGYPREQACVLLARDPSMIASFSRAMVTLRSRGFRSRGGGLQGRGDVATALSNLRGQDELRDPVDEGEEAEQEGKAHRADIGTAP
jgi:fructose-bisphosphate aldolase class I